jgi:poly(A) polymerase/tRNA nucleotidyltransferase (CCA-adding enzyme)
VKQVKSAGRVRKTGAAWRHVPSPVREVLQKFWDSGLQAYLVGGCVRDLCLGKKPNDWDIATNALPERVQELFEHTRPTGIEHGTVTVICRSTPVEVTTYRVESEYSDFRRPDRVEFTGDIEADLARRDFTINALAMGREGELIDCFEGVRDLKRGLIRAVGSPAERFQEDALRMMRAVRFAAQLGFSIDGATFDAIRANCQLLQHVSVERIRDEFTKLLMSDSPAYAVELLKEGGLLQQFLPEILEGVCFKQNRHHKYNVWEHNLLALEHIANNAPQKLQLRLAALLHDVAKPRTLVVDEAGRRHFYHHETEGEKLTQKILRRLRYDNKTIKDVCHLVRHHLSLHHYPDMSDAAIRRLIRRVGLDYLDDLLYLRAADRAASGTKKGPISGGTQVLLQRIEKVLAEDAAFGLKDLAVDGHDVMEEAGLSPGPLVGSILEELLEEVLDEPEKNTREYLLERIAELGGTDDNSQEGE